MRASLLKYQYVNELNPDNKHFIVELDSLLYSKQLKGDVCHGLTEWQNFLNAALLPGRVAQLVPPAPAAQSPRSLTMERRREPAQGQCPQPGRRYSPNIRSLGEPGGVTSRKQQAR